jgi:TetR/AcrR family transcriptional regulator, regulator of biofilm formation and stress response
MAERRHRPSTLERRDALLKATKEVAAEEGYAAITHRAVTERAGLPIATVGYFFSSIDELAEEALRTYTREDIDQQLAVADALADMGAGPEQVIDAFAASSAPRTPDTLALIEAYLRAARHPVARGLVEESMAASRQVAAAAARLAGAPDPDTMAASLFALILGAALQGVAVPGSIDTDQIRRTLRTLLVGSLFESGQTDAARRLLDGGENALRP